MARACDICGKGTASGKSVTFSHRQINRTFKANVHKIKAIVDGTPKLLTLVQNVLKVEK